MRKSSFLIGLVCGSLLFSGLTAFANAEIIAKLTSQIFFWNNQKIELEAYNINGYNYVRLRDAAELFGVNIEYHEDTDTVYLGEVRKEKTKIDGKAYAKEDYSLKANSDIFDDVYTRDAYNAIRQSIIDIAEITKNTDENGYNTDYEYGHFVDDTSDGMGETIEVMKSVTATMFGYYNFSFGYEPTISNFYEYPGYRICKPQIHKHFEPANNATDGFIVEISNLTDLEKVKRIADYICDRVAYKNENAAGINRVFTETPPVNAICGTYSNAFVYLCQRAKIPCISVVDDVHAWNEVYVDGEWNTTDISYYDVARTDEYLFPKNYPRTDINKQKTNFAKELLVPGSTKSTY
ncbi:MAG: hypothetical protein IJE70_02975 [Oscillospiraceae bacterium]|nr:hypothetical protein [Oscillospiraceae bacterium]